MLDICLIKKLNLLVDSLEFCKNIYNSALWRDIDFFLSLHLVKNES